MSAQDLIVLAVFAVVYLGMILGSLPRLYLDRSGIALLGAIAIIGFDVMTPQQAAAAVNLPTMLLLFAFMVISAQLRLGGFYAHVTQRIAALPLPPAVLLAVVIAVVGLLAAVFSNDVVCLAVAPVLADGCLRRRLDPVPFLLGLACAANIGSAATLIGNPQNMLIGQSLGLDFGAYLLEAAVPVVLGLVVLWALLLPALRSSPPPRRAPTPVVAELAAVVDAPPFDRWQTAKGLGVAAALVAVFLCSDWPHDVAALVGAGLLLLSQRFQSSRMMGLVDWQLLILFFGLFVVNAAMQRTGLAAQAVQALADAGVRLGEPAPLFATTLVLSNLVSNVPAVMLLLPVAQGAHAGATLALVSTLAGNLLIVGSIANIIVVDAARRHGIVIDWARHARVGVPVTLATLAIAAGWLAWRAGG